MDSAWKAGIKGMLGATKRASKKWWNRDVVCDREDAAPLLITVGDDGSDFNEGWTDSSWDTFFLLKKLDHDLFKFSNKHKSAFWHLHMGEDLYLFKKKINKLKNSLKCKLF